MLKRLRGRINLGLEVIKAVKNWPHVFKNYFKISNKSFTSFKFRDKTQVKIRNIQNEYDTSGIATIWEIFIRKNYNPKGMEINTLDNVIDIGANIGVFSLYAALRAKFGKVYSYEPFKPHYNRLLENIALNKLKNISAFELGISGKKTKKELFINNQSSGMHSIVFNKNSKNKTTINCITLEDIFKQNKLKKCDFLKMDCEGAEYDIIFNTKKDTFKKINKIALEFDNIGKERNCFKLKEILERNDFEVLINGAHEHQGILYARKIKKIN